ncbi:MAG: hypothetical protein K2M68_09050, partial [Muribaculaceae bacterium]|nr:hypothetical protein [Muribaculaceae bacterium]
GGSNMSLTTYSCIKINKKQINSKIFSFFLLYKNKMGRHHSVTAHQDIIILSIGAIISRRWQVS